MNGEMGEYVRRELVKFYMTEQAEVSKGVVEREGYHGAVVELLDRELGVLALRLRAYVWSEDLQQDTATLEVKIPATWWDHMKKDALPAWVARRWPPRMVTITKTYQFKMVALLPDFSYAAPVDQDRVVIKTFVMEDTHAQKR